MNKNFSRNTPNGLFRGSLFNFSCSSIFRLHFFLVSPALVYNLNPKKMVEQNKNDIGKNRISNMDHKVKAENIT